MGDGLREMTASERTSGPGPLLLCPVIPPPRHPPSQGPQQLPLGFQLSEFAPSGSGAAVPVPTVSSRAARHEATYGRSLAVASG